ncbi:hypothetical protein [Fodinicola acaciae]|uniref:hypothetical protein n=1 Tax=Fodinicola acaciae TaxID=2681555 RepID=UPI0013D05AF9|nr:hypothetical protein [Fodinicola acaciae]
MRETSARLLIAGIGCAAAVGTAMCLPQPAAATVVTTCERTVCLDIDVNISGPLNNWTATAYTQRTAPPYVGHFDMELHTASGAVSIVHGKEGAGPPLLSVSGTGQETVCAIGYRADGTLVGRTCQQT